MALALSVSTLLAPSGAFAQDAGVEDCEVLPLMRPETTFPNDSAISVSIDAPLRIRYTEGYFGPLGPGAMGDPTTLVTVQQCPGGGCDIFSCDDDLIVLQ